MTILDICTWLETTPIAVMVRESALLFPWLEAIHVAAVTLVLGFIVILDARLLGLFSKNEAVTKMTNELTPWVWRFFAVAAVTGLLMFSGTASKYITNPPFLLKMSFLAAAAINMGLFHFTTYRGVARWDRALPPPAAARLAGGLSIALWVSIIAIGRYIGFTLN